MTCIAQESLLKITKSQQETVKPKKLLRRESVQSLGIGDSRTSIMPYTTFCLMIPKRRLSLEGKPPKSIIMRSRERCIVDHRMRSCSAVCHKRSHRKYSKKRMMTCVELINPVQNSEIDSEDWDIIGLR